MKRKSQEKELDSKRKQNYRANHNKSIKAQENKDSKRMQNYRASHDIFTKNKDEEIDSKFKLNYRCNLEEPVKEKIKFSNKKRKENSLVLKRDITKEIFNSPEIEAIGDPSVLSSEGYRIIKKDYEQQFMQIQCLLEI